ncbi:hypothetical protein X765_32050, partial [Mesorhizobium sp. LSHC440B00]|uniref:IS481 family transposase n=1 Tax=Mesorhizobium sp. LSHC440B00 TaxID=1287308 RepID=UPI0003CDF5F4
NIHILEILRLAMATSIGARLQRKSCAHRCLGCPHHSFRRGYGTCYRSKAFAKACRDLGLKHVRTRPYTPKTSGKAERFIQTALREWAYAIAYPTSNHRAAELPVWLHRYNWHRPHGSLKSKTPISRLALTEDNLLRLHT